MKGDTRIEKGYLTLIVSKTVDLKFLTRQETCLYHSNNRENRRRSMGFWDRHLTLVKRLTDTPTPQERQLFLSKPKCFDHIVLYIFFFQIRTEKSKVACCVCPGDCGKTYPRSVSKIYSKGVKVFRLYFAIRGPGEKSNFNVHLYICPRNSTSDVINQNCLLKNPLHIIRSFKNDKVLKLDVEVPRNLSCHHCLIQWAITKGNS